MPLQRLKPHWLVLVVLMASVIAASSFGARPAMADDPPPANPQGLVLDAGFTYQAVVRKDGLPVTATCFFRYGLWDSSSGGVQLGVTGTVGIVPVVNGLVTLRLNSQGTAFGPDPFKGEQRYLAMEVRCGGESSFTPLTPRQALTPTPYALALPGLHTEPNNTSPNIIGGAFENAVTAGVVGATISGGGSSGDANRVTDNYGTVAGGNFNRAGNSAGLLDDAELATVGGGESNNASGRLSTVAGGQDSNASGDYSFVGGGGDNDAKGEGSVVAGGVVNLANGRYSTIGGGFSNHVTGLTATVPGGQDNLAGGNYSFAAGRNAQANHSGAFVWADGSTTGPFASDRNNQFKIKAAGGVVISATATAGLSPSALEVQNGGSNSVAIHAHQISADATLVVGNNGTGDQIKAFNAGGLVFRVTNAGAVSADGAFTPGGADFAEMLPASPGLAAGDVLVIGPDGELARSTQAFQTSVAGVYSTKPGFVGGGLAEGSQPGDIPLAVVGVVPVCASAENGAIHPGDLLVTSATPGCAMRAGANPPVGTVIGKALQGLASGTGLIKLLATLQ
jgi:hypothetical protein